MIGQSGIENLLNFFMFREVVSHSTAVAVVLQHAHRQSFHAAQNQPALERRKDGAGSFLKKSEVLRLVGFGADDDASQAVAVSVQKFRRGMDHHVGAEFDRMLEIRRHESVVHDDLEAAPVAEFVDRVEIAKLHQRVGRRLQEQQPGVLLEGALNLVEIGCINVGECKTKAGKDLIEEPVRVSVEYL